MKRLYWHGTTSKKKVQSILKNGFNRRTWFAKHLEDALEFGGKYVFAIVIDFKKDTIFNTSWQVCSSKKISPDHIVWVEKFEIERTNKNEELIKDFFGED